MPKYSKGKGKGKNGKGAKGNGKGDVEMGAAGYMGHDYWNYDYSDYSMYHPSLFAGDLGALTKIGDISTELTPKVLEQCPSDAGAETATSFRKPKRVYKPCKDFAVNIHESLRYKPIATENKYAVFADDLNTAEEPAAKAKDADFNEPTGKLSLTPTAQQNPRRRVLQPQHKRRLCSAFSKCCEDEHEVWGDIGFPTDEALAETFSGENSEKNIAPIFLATVANPELTEKIRRIKEKCTVERREAEAERAGGSEVKTLLAQMMGVVNHDNRIDDWASWKVMSIAIDSGAAETVVPHTLITEYPIYSTARSEAGECYASATGEPIPNLGEQRLPLATAEGSLRAMTFQAAPVAKPLGSVDRICEAGHVVVFDSDGSYIFNKKTEEINWLRRENGNYMLDVWVPPASQVDPDIWKKSQPPFGRQP